MNFPFALARRYIFSGQNALEVNVISWIAFIALTFVTTCLLVILSVFSGLEDLNLKFYSDINPDLRISPTKGKLISNADSIYNSVLADFSIAAASKQIEEKAFAQYNNKSHIVNLRGVDRSINRIFSLDSMLQIGEPLNFNNFDQVIIGPSIAKHLSLYLDIANPINLSVPTPGKGIISNTDEAFTSVSAYSQGVFFINDSYDNTLFAPIELVQNLLNLDSQSAYFIDLRLKENTNSKQIQADLSKSLGDTYKVISRQEIDAAFLKMMNIENLIIYLIFVLILIIASFNLAGTIGILILDKREETKTLWSMGMDNSAIKKAFFYTGFSISLYALIIGVILGTILSYLQQQYGLVMVSAFVPFPVKFSLLNYLITSLSVLGIGLVVSYLVSRKASVPSTT